MLEHGRKGQQSKIQKANKNQGRSCKTEDQPTNRPNQSKCMPFFTSLTIHHWSSFHEEASLPTHQIPWE